MASQPLWREAEEGEKPMENRQFNGRKIQLQERMQMDEAKTSSALRLFSLLLQGLVDLGALDGHLGGRQ